MSKGFQGRNDDKGGRPGGGRGTSTAAVQADRTKAYRDGQGKLRPELFDREAIEEADRWGENRITASQLRRFFGAVRAFLQQADARVGQAAEHAPSDSDAMVSMAMLKASATYAAARDPKHEPIRDFFEHHARLVDGVQAFRDFARHFEAVVAYHKKYDPKS